MKRSVTLIMLFLVFGGILSMVSMSLAGEGVWTRKADMPTARQFFAISVVDDIIYAIGGTGVDFAESLLVVEAYDPVTDTWTKKADMPHPGRRNLSASVVDGIIYAIGGNYGVPTVEAYDPVTDTWAKKADMPAPRFWLTTSVVDGIIYAIGGGTGYIRGVSRVEAYDPKTDTWTKKADMPTPRWLHSAAVVDGIIYVIGGTAGTDYDPLPTVEAYDPVTDTWTSMADMPTAVLDTVAAVVDKRIYIAGGSTVGGSIEELTGSALALSYDPRTDTWERETDMPTKRTRLSNSAVNGRIFALGGSDIPYQTLSAIVEEYTPPNAAPVSAQSKLAATWGKIKRGG